MRLSGLVGASMSVRHLTMFIFLSSIKNRNLGSVIGSFGLEITCMSVEDRVTVSFLEPAGEKGS